MPPVLIEGPSEEVFILLPKSRKSVGVLREIPQRSKINRAFVELGFSMNLHLDKPLVRNKGLECLWIGVGQMNYSD